MLLLLLLRLGIETKRRVFIPNLTGARQERERRNFMPFFMNPVGPAHTNQSRGNCFPHFYKTIFQNIHGHLGW